MITFGEFMYVFEDANSLAAVNQQISMLQVRIQQLMQRTQQQTKPLQDQLTRLTLRKAQLEKQQQQNPQQDQNNMAQQQQQPQTTTPGSTGNATPGVTNAPAPAQ